jgi:hypothetical protein
MDLAGLRQSAWPADLTMAKVVGVKLELEGVDLRDARGLPERGAGA